MGGHQRHGPLGKPTLAERGECESRSLGASGVSSGAAFGPRG